MNKVWLKKILLSVLIVIILSLGLVGCTALVLWDEINNPSNSNSDNTEDTGTVYLVLSGEYICDISMDGKVEKQGVSAGMHQMLDVPYGSHTFEAKATNGSCVKAVKTQTIQESETTIYLTPSPQGAKVFIYLTSTYPDHHYNIYMDSTLYHANVSLGTYTIKDVPIDETYEFEVIHHRGVSFGSTSQNVSIMACEENVNFSLNF